jgi:hypothetical protein
MGGVVRRRNRLILIGAAVVSAVILAGLAVFAGPIREAGTALPIDAARVTRSALDAFGKIGDTKLTGVVATENGVPLSMEIVARADGQATATVRDPAGGVADIVATTNRVAIKANRAWWLNTVPSYAQQLADKWVQSRPEMGFPTEMLRVLSGKPLSDLITSQTAEQDWNATVTQFDGKRAYELYTVDRTWAVYVSTDAEPKLLGFGGPLLDGVPRRMAGSAGGQRSDAYRNAQFSTAAADPDCAERSEKQLKEAKPQVDAAPPAPPAPSATRGPQISLQPVPSPTCTGPVCPATVIVRNSGDEPAVGTLTMTASTGGGGAYPVSVGPGQTSTHTITVPNPASRCTRTCTVPFTVSAFVMVTSMGGPDVDAGQRLHQRNVDPNRPVPGNPAASGPAVVNVMDDMLRSAPPPPAGFGRQQDSYVAAVRAMVNGSITNRMMSQIEAIGDSGALAHSGDFLKHPLLLAVKQAVDGADEDQRATGRVTVDVLAELATKPGRTAGSLTVANGVVIDSQNKRVYSVAGLGIDTRSKAERKANPGPPLGAPEERVMRALKGAIDRFAGAQNPADYAKVVTLWIDPTVNTFGNQPRARLVDFLAKDKVNGTEVRSLFADPQGKPVVSELIISNGRSRKLAYPPYNGSYGFGPADIRALAHHFDPNNPPNAPPAPGSMYFSDTNLRHIMEGDPYDPSDPEAKQDSGGHRGGAGVPGKSEFPLDWTEQDIKDAMIQVGSNRQNLQRGAERNGNHMAVAQWGWTFIGDATIKGITVRITVRVLADGEIRTGYPDDQNPTGAAWDRDKVYVNPSAMTPIPALPNTAGGTQPIKLTDRPRIQRSQSAMEKTRMVFKGVDASGRKVEVRTDEKGKYNSSTDVTNPDGQATPPAPTVLTTC